MEENILEFKNALHRGSIKFKYRKKNGEEREALGTLNEDIIINQIPERSTGVKTINYPENQIRYYDLVSNGWRSFLSENLISWEYE